MPGTSFCYVTDLSLNFPRLGGDIFKALLGGAPRELIGAYVALLSGFGYAPVLFFDPRRASLDTKKSPG